MNTLSVRCRSHGRPIGGMGKRALTQTASRREQRIGNSRYSMERDLSTQERYALIFFFEMPIPSTMPKKIIRRLEAGERVWHEKRPDRSNLEKHAADCLTGSVLSDDNIIVSGQVQKYYSFAPKTIIIVENLSGYV